MRETEHFINDGYGWTCKHCRGAEGTPTRDRPAPARARFFHEGEAEERETRLSTPALARWRDSDTPGQRLLHCPSCGTEETMKDELIH